LEAAENESFRVERRIVGGIHARIVMHPFLGGLEGRFIGPDLPRKNDLLTFPGGYGFAEIGLRAVGNVILPAFDDLDAATFLEESRTVFCPATIGIDATLGMTRPQTYMLSSLFLQLPASSRRRRTS
jgi:hypothetical protein